MKRTKWKAVQTAAASYQRSRRALRKLGVDAADAADTGKRLRDSDVRAFTAFIKQDKPGESKKKTAFVDMGELGGCGRPGIC